MTYFLMNFEFPFSARFTAKADHHPQVPRMRLRKMIGELSYSHKESAAGSPLTSMRE